MSKLYSWIIPHHYLWYTKITLLHTAVVGSADYWELQLITSHTSSGIQSKWTKENQRSISIFLDLLVNISILYIYSNLVKTFSNAKHLTTKIMKWSCISLYLLASWLKLNLSSTSNYVYITIIFSYRVEYKFTNTNNIKYYKCCYK